MNESSRENACSEIAEVLNYAAPRISRPKKSRAQERVAVYSVFLLMCAAGVLVLLPTLGRVGCGCGKTRCGANLHQIVSALYLYAEQHDGRFPDSWETIIAATDSPMAPKTWAKLLVCPSSNDTPALGTTADEIAKDIFSLGRPEQFLDSKSHPSLHLSYIYIGKGITNKSAPNTVVVYEPLDHHTIEKVPALNVAYRDGSVRKYSGPTAVKLFADLQAGRNPPSTQIPE